MKNLICAGLACLIALATLSQSQKIKAQKYPSLLWEITGNGMKRPSYLFGTMHVSSKMAFHLSDSFYLGIKNAQVVALETNPGTWQQDFDRYDLAGQGGYFGPMGSTSSYSSPQDFLTRRTLQIGSYEKTMEAGLYSNPAMINNFLYRTRSDMESDFEEDTYLDLHIYQAGKKLGKKLCGVEDFDGSMQLVREAYEDASKEKNKKERRYDYDENFSLAKLEEAYRTGNLDWLDTIHKVNSQSAAFDEKFLYKRNDIQADGIDSLIRTGARVFAGVGAAHLPGDRGVIEILRRKGYKLRPIRMRERDSHHKDAIDKIRVPVVFTTQVSPDGMYQVKVPGKLFSFGDSYGSLEMKQFADMSNGSYYMVSRIVTHAALLGHSINQVKAKLDSVLYQNVPGRIIRKKNIERNGYPGFDIVNRTRRGDVQRYNIYVTPLEILIFKMSGNGGYLLAGTEADQFFGSVQLRESILEWKEFSPSYGGFRIKFPHQPIELQQTNRVYAAFEPVTSTAYAVLRTDVYNHGFVEQDSFDLALMEESFSSSDFISRKLSVKSTTVDNYPALDVMYRYKDSSVAQVRFLINGPRYYTLIAKSPKEHHQLKTFIQSFSIRPFQYEKQLERKDTNLHFSVKSPVALDKEKKLEMFADGGYEMYGADEDSHLADQGKFYSKLVINDSTGERIYVSFSKPSAYAYISQPGEVDSTYFKKTWTIRKTREDSLPGGWTVLHADLGNSQSSRMLKTKEFRRNGIAYSIESLVDTITGPGRFVNDFFATFKPVDTVRGIDVSLKKTDLFFSQFFSTDSLEHKRAVKNLGIITMDSSDLPQLMQAINTLGWKEKKYLDVKKELIGKLSVIPTREVSDYLAQLYFNAGDTIELQYAALETLLWQGTPYSFKSFSNILQNDPPVLELTSSSSTVVDYGYNSYPVKGGNSNNQNSYFLAGLYDSLHLTKEIFPSILPLINLDDYEQPMMELLGEMVDSALVDASTYEMYLPKFLIEAKQLAKKQAIQEKNKSIEKARKEDEDDFYTLTYNRNTGDEGNPQLSLYAKLLMPFWNKNAQVPVVIEQLLHSNDKTLKYNTMMLLLKQGKAVPDSLFSFFTEKNEYRFQLFHDLELIGKANLFPAADRQQVKLATSELLQQQTYNKPDTIQFIEKRRIHHEGVDGCVLFFKYKEKKDDLSWRLASAGLFPVDDTKYYFAESTVPKVERYRYDFKNLSDIKLDTEKTEAEQVSDFLKRIVISKRKSGAQFYADSYTSDFDYFRSQY